MRVLAAYLIHPLTLCRGQTELNTTHTLSIKSKPIICTGFEKSHRCRLLVSECTYCVKSAAVIFRNKKASTVRYYVLLHPYCSWNFGIFPVEQIGDCLLLSM